MWTRNVTFLKAVRLNRRAFLSTLLIASLWAISKPAAAQKILATIPIGSNSIFFVDVNPKTNQVYTSGGASFGQVITWIDGNANMVRRLLGTGSGAKVNPLTNKIYAGAVFSPFGGILVYDGGTGNLLRTIFAFGCPFEASIDTSNNHIWGGAQCGAFNDPVFLIDGQTDGLISGPIGSGGVMGSLVVNPVTHKAYVSASGISKEVNPNTFAVTRTPFSGPVVCVNPNPSNNKLYTSNQNPVQFQVVDGSTESVIRTLLAGSFVGGCAVNATRNRVYAADLTSQTIKVFDGTSNNLISSLPIPSGDHLGAIAVNTATGDVYVTVQNPGGLFDLLKMSDETGNQPPVANAGADQTVECTSHTGTLVTLDGSKSSDPDGDPLTFRWTDKNGNVIGTTAVINRTLPLGTFTFNLTVTDPGGLSSTATTHVTVRDTTPPTLSVSLSPNMLWPPNHKFVQIMADIQVSDICDPNPRVTLVSITSNEPGIANDVQGAMIGTDSRSFFLRAERLGTGTGRMYTVRYRVMDASGNMTFATATVSVPHDQRLKAKK